MMFPTTAAFVCPAKKLANPVRTICHRTLIWVGGLTGRINRGRRVVACPIQRQRWRDSTLAQKHTSAGKPPRIIIRGSLRRRRRPACRLACSAWRDPTLPVVACRSFWLLAQALTLGPPHVLCRIWWQAPVILFVLPDTRFSLLFLHILFIRRWRCYRIRYDQSTPVLNTTLACSALTDRFKARTGKVGRNCFV